MKDAVSYGWEVDPNAVKHNWETMVGAVTMHVKSLNFGYRADLMSNSVKYYNAFATFTDEKTVVAVDKKGKETRITADAFVLAPGGRPRYRAPCPNRAAPPSHRHLRHPYLRHLLLFHSQVP